MSSALGKSHDIRISAVVFGSSVIVVRLLLAIAAMTGLVIFAGLLVEQPSLRFVLVLSGVSFFSLALDTSWVYKGLERNRPVCSPLLWSPRCSHWGPTITFVLARRSILATIPRNVLHAHRHWAFSG